MSQGRFATIVLIVLIVTGLVVFAMTRAGQAAS